MELYHASGEIVEFPEIRKGKYKKYPEKYFGNWRSLGIQHIK